MRAVMDRTSENVRSAHGIKRSALATIHSQEGYRRAAASTAGIEMSTPCASQPVRAARLAQVKPFTTPGVQNSVDEDTT